MHVVEQAAEHWCDTAISVRMVTLFRGRGDAESGKHSQPVVAADPGDAAWYMIALMTRIETPDQMIRSLASRQSCPSPSLSVERMAAQAGERDFAQQAGKRTRQVPARWSSPPLHLA